MCEQQCGKPLSCKNHKCSSICHRGKYYVYRAPNKGYIEDMLPRLLKRITDLEVPVFLLTGGGGGIGGRRGGATLKGKNLLSGEQILSFKCSFHQKTDTSTTEANTVDPFYNNGICSPKN